VPRAVADDQSSNSTPVLGYVYALIEHFMFDENGFAYSVNSCRTAFAADAHPHG
jgi:hypothetical protein